LFRGSFPDSKIQPGPWPHAHDADRDNSFGTRPLEPKPRTPHGNQTAHLRLGKILSDAAARSVRECKVGVVALHSAMVVCLARVRVDPTLWPEHTCVRSPQYRVAVGSPRAEDYTGPGRDMRTEDCGCRVACATDNGHGWEEAECFIAHGVEVGKGFKKRS
jgi:hypothetical protein